MNRYDFFKTFTKGMKFKKVDWEVYNKGEKPVKEPITTVNNEDSGVESASAETEPPPKRPKKIHGPEKLLQIKQEGVNALRNKYKIHTWGQDIPDPISTFEELSDSLVRCKSLVENLQKEGYKSPTPIQMQTWSLMMKGRNILACAPTGSGKTAAFLVPLIEHLERPRKLGFRAVIVSPTRELATQIFRECKRLCETIGLRPYMINTVNKAKEKFGTNNTKKFDILVTTPNRLVFMLKEEDCSIDLSNVEWLIIDESDRLFEGGMKGFRDQMADIYQACSRPDVKRAFFSATFAHDLEQWCKLNLDNVAAVNIGQVNSACTDITQELLFCGSEDGKFLGLQNVIRETFDPPVLIFVQTKERAKDLFLKMLWHTKIELVDYISADRTQKERDNSVLAFREHKIWVLICTEVLARGIDFKGVNLVINYDFPPTKISYIHRIGRTGRANKKGKAVTFWTEDDRANLPPYARIIKESGCHVEDWMLAKSKKKKKKSQDNTKKPHQGPIGKDVECFKYLKRQQKHRKKLLRQMKSESNKKAADDQQNINTKAGNSTYKESTENKSFKRKRKSDKSDKIKKRKIND